MVFSAIHPLDPSGRTLNSSIPGLTGNAAERIHWNRSYSFPCLLLAFSNSGHRDCRNHSPRVRKQNEKTLRASPMLVHFLDRLLPVRNLQKHLRPG